MAAESQGIQARSAQVEPKAYKSPQRKLVPFFARSREQWKEKCRGAKATLKQLKKKVQRGDARWDEENFLKQRAGSDPVFVPLGAARQRARDV